MSMEFYDKEVQVGGAWRVSPIWSNQVWMPHLPSIIFMIVSFTFALLSLVNHDKFKTSEFGMIHTEFSLRPFELLAPCCRYIVFVTCCLNKAFVQQDRSLNNVVFFSIEIFYFLC